MKEIILRGLFIYLFIYCLYRHPITTATTKTFYPQILLFYTKKKKNKKGGTRNPKFHNPQFRITQIPQTLAISHGERLLLAFPNPLRLLQPGQQVIQTLIPDSIL